MLNLMISCEGSEEPKGSSQFPSLCFLSALLREEEEERDPQQRKGSEENKINEKIANEIPQKDAIRNSTRDDVQEAVIAAPLQVSRCAVSISVPTPQPTVTSMLRFILDNCEVNREELPSLAFLCQIGESEGAPLHMVKQPIEVPLPTPQREARLEERKPVNVQPILRAKHEAESAVLVRHADVMNGPKTLSSRSKSKRHKKATKMEATPGHVAAPASAGVPNAPVRATGASTKAASTSLGGSTWMPLFESRDASPHRYAARDLATTTSSCDISELGASSQAAHRPNDRNQSYARRYVSRLLLSGPTTPSQSRLRKRLEKAKTEAYASNCCLKSKCSDSDCDPPLLRKRSQMNFGTPQSVSVASRDSRPSSASRLLDKIYKDYAGVCGKDMHRLRFQTYDDIPNKTGACSSIRGSHMGGSVSRCLISLRRLEEAGNRFNGLMMYADVQANPSCFMQLMVEGRSLKFATRDLHQQKRNSTRT
uniref:Uncharacterized protein n=1 Tax=Trypanosoma congolense (strain IL3000) TaxID=1068625 RepID=G0UKI1_TRYCI|nr:conserved hypothetical protein [Trypanosoma congolense IL3000]